MACPVRSVRQTVEEPSPSLLSASKALNYELKQFYTQVLQDCRAQLNKLNHCRVEVIKGANDKQSCRVEALNYTQCALLRDKQERRASQNCGSLIGEFGSLKERADQCISENGGDENAINACTGLVKRFRKCSQQTVF